MARQRADEVLTIKELEKKEAMKINSKSESPELKLLKMGSALGKNVDKALKEFEKSDGAKAKKTEERSKVHQETYLAINEQNELLGIAQRNDDESEEANIVAKLDQLRTKLTSPPPVEEKTKK